MKLGYVCLIEQHVYMMQHPELRQVKILDPPINMIVDQLVRSKIIARRLPYIKPEYYESTSYMAVSKTKERQHYDQRRA